MKKIFLAFSLILLFSCTESKYEDKPIVENAVDNTDSSIKSSFGSGRDEDLIDKIYSELIKNDKKLSILDDKMLKTYEKSKAVLENYQNVLNKSESYYTAANFHAKTITDSILKQKIESQIKMSSEKYDLKIKKIKNIISLLDKNTEKINDFYSAFKIRKTLPEIEKYQNAHPLKTDSLEKFIEKQNKLLIELKNLK